MERERRKDRDRKPRRPRAIPIRDRPPRGRSPLRREVVDLRPRIPAPSEIKKTVRMGKEKKRDLSPGRELVVKRQLRAILERIIRERQERARQAREAERMGSEDTRGSGKLTAEQKLQYKIIRQLKIINEKNNEKFEMGLVENDKALKFIRGESDKKKLKEYVNKHIKKLNKFLDKLNDFTQKIESIKDNINNSMLNENNKKLLEKNSDLILSRVQKNIKTLFEELTFLKNSTLKKIGKRKSPAFKEVKTKEKEKDWVIQSIAFPKETYDVKRAKKWLKEVGTKYKKADMTENFIRFRQEDPDEFGEYKTKVLPNGIQIILAK